MRKVIAIVVLAIGCLVNAYCNGQGPPIGTGGWNAIPQLRTSEGIGTGFVVASSDTEVEIWTAAHVAGEAGSAVTVVWQDGSETQGTVARSRLGPVGTTTEDEAKIIAAKPKSLEVVAFSVGGVLGDGFYGSFAGYGNQSYLRESEALPTKVQGIHRRVQLVPAAIPGDSGGPVFDVEGNVVAVVVQVTLNRRRERMSTLVIPINRWIDWK